MAAVSKSLMRGKRHNRTQNFTNADKHALVREVKKWPRLWNLADPLRCTKHAVDQAWLEISKIMNKSPNECKQAWTSLRESHRYFSKPIRNSKNGSNYDDPLLETGLKCNVDWEFADDMAFLPYISQKRTSMVSPGSFEESNHSESQEEVSQCNYRPSTKRRRVQTQAPEHSQLLNRIDKIMDSMDTNEQDSPYQGALSTFDWLLRELPVEVAKDACLRINELLLNIVMEEKSK